MAHICYELQLAYLCIEFVYRNIFIHKNVLTCLKNLNTMQ